MGPEGVSFVGPFLEGPLSEVPLYYVASYACESEDSVGIYPPGPCMVNVPFMVHQFRLCTCKWLVCGEFEGPGGENTGEVHTYT